MAPIISYLINKGYMRSVAFGQTDVFEAAVIFARTEGIIPAPESAHEIRFVIDEAIRCREKREAKVIVFNNSGHGLLDLSAYQAYLEGKLEDWAPDEDRVPGHCGVRRSWLPLCGCSSSRMYSSKIALTLSAARPVPSVTPLSVTLIFSMTMIAPMSSLTDDQAGEHPAEPLPERLVVEGLLRQPDLADVVAVHRDLEDVRARRRRPCPGRC